MHAMHWLPDETYHTAGGLLLAAAQIFGATEEDLSRLRIKNLYEAELDLEALVAEDDDDGDKGSGDGSSDKAAKGSNEGGSS